MSALPTSDPSMGCHCQYPIGLVIFLVFTIISLLLCICVCCFDVTKCPIFKRKETQCVSRKCSSFDPRLFDTSKFIVDRKISLDPRLLEYSQLVNSSTSSSTQSRSVDIPYYGMDSAYVTTV
ncbi:unnamed protein product [Auanema sp. JU1783]|nr:unnamed protein product [Auanema sp. JU1783]